MRRAGVSALVVTVSGGFYMILIDTVSLPELYAMCGVLLLALVAFEISRRQGLPDLALKPRWLLSAWRPLTRAPSQILLVSAEAIAQLFKPQPVRGQFRAVPFRGGEDASDLGRQALSESLGSFTPNTIVIGIDSERNLLLVHQLRRQGGPEELDVLRLG